MMIGKAICWAMVAAIAVLLSAAELPALAIALAVLGLLIMIRRNP